MIGRVYKIIHLDSSLCYIGSTCDTLPGRWRTHKNAYKTWLSDKDKYNSVALHKDSNMKADDDSPEGYSLSLQYANVVPILHSAIRTLRDEITSLRDELAAVTGASTPPKKPKKPKSVL